MAGIVIEYDYSGDEAAWTEAVDSFIASVGADAEISGDFSYMVTRVGDGPTRIHVGRWGAEETVKTLQGRDYFKIFAEAIKGFAGGAPNARRVDVVAATG